jgi:hypothetical protein
MVNWKSHNDLITGVYPPGSTVTVVKFAWLPTKGTGGNTYWLIRLKTTWKRSNGLFRHESVTHPSLHSAEYMDGYWEIESVLPLDS